MNIIENILRHRKKTKRLLARFGSARLVMDEYGRVQLVGGDKNEQAEALEWISFFMHEAAPVIKPDDK